jgi:hypothetical protein
MNLIRISEVARTGRLDLMGLLEKGIHSEFEEAKDKGSIIYFILKSTNS